MFCDVLEERDGGGRVQEGGDICIHVADSPYCIAETNALMLQKKKNFFLNPLHLKREGSRILFLKMSPELLKVLYLQNIR